MKVSPRFLRTVALVVLSIPLVIWAEAVDFVPQLKPLLGIGIGCLVLFIPIAMVLDRAQAKVEWEEGLKAARFDVRQISSRELAFGVMAVAFLLLIMGWFNAALTVDLVPIVLGVIHGKFWAIGLGVGLMVLLALFSQGLLFFFGRYQGAFRLRRQSPLTITLRYRGQEREAKIN